jgi:hypothetical protein
MSSLSLLRRFSTWMVAIRRAIGAITASMLGMASVVMARKRSASCPWVVISSSCRRATPIQTTLTSDIRMTSVMPATCRNTYRLNVRPRPI